MRLPCGQSIVRTIPFVTNSSPGNYGINIKTVDIKSNNVVENLNFNLPIRSFDKIGTVENQFGSYIVWTYTYRPVLPQTFSGDF